MAGYALNRADATMFIDETLTEYFNKYAEATYNVLIEKVREAVQKGEKKLKGSIYIGYDPFIAEYEAVRFDIQDNDIIGTFNWAA